MTPETTAIAANVTPVVIWRKLFLLLVLIVREMVRKGIALRKAGTKKQLGRFVCLFIFNTVGILPIIYLIFFQKKEQGKK